MRVSKNTPEIIGHLKEALEAESIDEVIQILIKQHRKNTLKTSIGLDQADILLTLKGWGFYTSIVGSVGGATTLLMASTPFSG